MKKFAVWFEWNYYSVKYVLIGTTAIHEFYAQIVNEGIYGFSWMQFA